MSPLNGTAKFADCYIWMLKCSDLFGIRRLFHKFAESVNPILFSAADCPYSGADTADFIICEPWVERKGYYFIEKR